MAMTSSNAIHTESLTRDFARVRAVDTLNLDVPQGVIFGFLGPNGAGKTTTIHLLLGLVEPTAGQAIVLGHNTKAEGYQVRSQTGVLLEHHGLYERMSAEDNLEFYGRIWGMSTAERQARIKELLTQIGLWERRKETVDKWSKGMKQKLAIARAILHRPTLLFLDEPTAGLDPVSSNQLHSDLIQLVRQQGITIFLTTHNLVEAEKLCQLVGVLRQGHLIAYGSPAELRASSGQPQAEITGSQFSSTILIALQQRPEVIAVELVTDNKLHLKLTNGTTAIAPLINLIVSQGGQIEEVRKGQENLEEVFLSLMQEAR